MRLLRPTVLTSQPQYAAGIDWSNPITTGLVTCIDQSGRSLIPSATLSDTNSFSPVATKKGLLLSNLSSGVKTVSSGNVVAPSGNKFTVLGLIALNATGQTNKYFAIDLNTSLNKQHAIIFGYVANNLEFYTDNYTGTQPRTGTGLSITDTQPHIFAYSYNGSNWKSFLDGTNVLNTTRTFSLSTTPNSRYLYASALATDIINGSIGLWLVFNRALSDAEIKSLSANPWQIFQSPRAIIPASTVTVQYARPTSDASTGTWTSSLGGDLYAAIDEMPASDTDYITTTSASTCEVTLGSLTDPTSSSGHIVRYRLSADAGSITVRLRQGTTTIASWVHSTPPTSATLFEQTLSGAEADAITSYSSLKLQFEAT